MTGRVTWRMAQFFVEVCGAVCGTVCGTMCVIVCGTVCSVNRCVRHLLWRGVLWSGVRRCLFIVVLRPSII